MKYKEAIKLLTSQKKFQINLGLERVLKTLELLDNPQNKIRIIHVAGTNGKGSVCAMLSNILKYAGYKTGLYTSPHLVQYTERIKINGTDISENDFAKYTELVCNTVANINLTEFEILTVAAYKYFYDKKVDIAVIETGLGGRFDATNTVKKPLIEIITSISLDHTDRLGNTIENIAFEKAGIIKENSNVIVSSDNLGFDVIKDVAYSKHANIITVDNNIKTICNNEQNYFIYNEKEYEFGLLGTYQNKNITLVIAATKLLNIPENSVTKGLKTVKWSARLEYIKEKNLLIDGAHNPDAACELKKSLDLYFPDKKRIFIYSTLNTKDYIQIAKLLFNANDKVYYYEFNHQHAVSYKEYKKQINWLNIEKIEDLESIINKKELKIICGSLYMIGEIYNRI